MSETIMDGTSNPQIETVIRPLAGVRFSELLAVYKYRELVWAMARRQVHAEYGNMVLGFCWAVARPLLMVLVLAVFRHLSDLAGTTAMPYPVYLYAGLVLWFFFLEATNDSSTALKRDANILKKVYYPRVISALSPVVANLSGLAIGFVPLILMMLWFQILPDWRLALLPLVLAQLCILVFGIGCVFSVLSLLSGDWQRVLSLSLYVGLFLSPVMYWPKAVEGAAAWLYFANPMAGTLMAFRATLSPAVPFPVAAFSYSLVLSLIVAGLGLALFQRAERDMVDRL